MTMAETSSQSEMTHKTSMNVYLEAACAFGYLVFAIQVGGITIALVLLYFDAFKSAQVRTFIPVNERRVKVPDKHQLEISRILQKEPLNQSTIKSQDPIGKNDTSKSNQTEE